MKRLPFFLGLMAVGMGMAGVSVVRGEKVVADFDEMPEVVESKIALAKAVGSAERVTGAESQVMGEGAGVVTTQPAKTLLGVDGPMAKQKLPEEKAIRAAMARINLGQVGRTVSREEPYGDRAYYTRLLMEGRRTEDPTERAASFFKSREAALEAGDAYFVYRALATIESYFETNAAEMYARDYAELGKRISNGRLRADLQFVIRSRLGTVALQEQFDLYPVLGKIGMEEAEKLEDKRYAANMQAAILRCKDAEAAFARFEKGKQELAKGEGDARSKGERDSRANRAVGEYLCFYRNNWSEGLPYLMRVSDGKMRAIATLTQAGPAKAEDFVAIADGWWEVAEGYPAYPQGVIRATSYRWYQRGLNFVAGPMRDHVKVQMERYRKGVLEEQALRMPPGTVRIISKNAF